MSSPKKMHITQRYVLKGKEIARKDNALVPSLSGGRRSGSQFCNALLIPKRIAPT